jgi:hypothetical protein
VTTTTIQASVGAVTVIEGAMENGVAAVAAEAVDAEASKRSFVPRSDNNHIHRIFRRRSGGIPCSNIGALFPCVDALLPTKKRAQPHLDASWSIRLWS